MNLIYISALSSDRIINDIHQKTSSNPGFAVQKFSRLIVRGLLSNCVECTALSTPPVTHQYTSKVWINVGDEVEDGISYKYIPFVNIPFIKHLGVFLYSFFYVLFWSIGNRKDRTVMCDVLCISASCGALLASKCCGLKSVAVVTDIYDQIVGNNLKGIHKFIKRVAGYVNRKYVGAFSHYVLLTEAMNEVVNPKHRPYTVMEALCDISDLRYSASVVKSYPKVIMYAGGLEERYGLKTLVEAFMSIKDDTIQLHLYGSGTYVSELQQTIKCDQRIKFWGVRSNDEIVKAEMKATLLVNPRFSTEEFTKYSFPSKNMEYMVSGTPVLTTDLPGMPKEYHDYVFLFRRESVDGYVDAIRETMSHTEQELMTMGRKARDFVIAKKNYKVQTKSMIELIGQ